MAVIDVFRASTAEADIPVLSYLLNTT